MPVCMTDTLIVKNTVAILKDADFLVEADYKAGTVKAYDGDTVVYQAIQKGRGGPWIVRYQDTDKIHWYQQSP